MNHPISVGGWILIIFLGLFILALNLSLFIGIKNKSNDENWINKMTQAGRKMKDPFQDENSRMRELSERVAELGKPRQDKK